jgi:MinD-like ATPase involved in chromosome partitioning or flagellar assembly
VSLPTLTAVTPAWEGPLAAHLGRSEHVHLARRCADLAELMGCAEAGIGRVAVVSVDLRGVDGTALARLAGHGLWVLGVYPPHDESGRDKLLRWGVGTVLPADVSVERLDEGLLALLASTAESGREGATQTLDSCDPRSADPGPGPATVTGADAEQPPVTADDVEHSAPQGRVLAVWGPTGSPGRSTVAVNVAAELARAEPVLLVDADTYGASVAQMLAILDEAPGVAAAARAADHGTLDSAALTRLAPLVQDELRVLTGLPRADRWPELREHAMTDVVRTARATTAWTVVDTGFCVEQDEEISFDTMAPRRNGAALSVLRSADEVLVVGRADPVGLQRTVRAVGELRDMVSAPLRVVVTRVRASAVGSDPHHRVRDVLSRFGGIDQVHLVPEDRDALDAALLHGATLNEVRPSSPARLALAELADAVAGRVAAGSGRTGRLRRRRS